MYLAQTKIFVYYILPRDLQFFPILQVLESFAILFSIKIREKIEDIQTKKEKLSRTSLSTPRCSIFERISKRLIAPLGIKNHCSLHILKINVNS